MLQTNCWETDQQKTISNIIKDLYPIIISIRQKDESTLQPNKFDSCQSSEILETHILMNSSKYIVFDLNTASK